MSIDDIQRRLRDAGLAVTRSRLGNNTGDQLRCKSGEIINIYDNGTIQFQGKNQDKIKEILGFEGGVAEPAEAMAAPSRKVFVVYGHKPSECRYRKFGNRKQFLTK